MPPNPWQLAPKVHYVDLPASRRRTGHVIQYLELIAHMILSNLRIFWKPFDGCRRSTDPTLGNPECYNVV